MRAVLRNLNAGAIFIEICIYLFDNSLFHFINEEGTRSTAMNVVQL